MREFLGSSLALIHLCMGLCLMIGVLHLWMSRRFGDANFWIAIWAGLSCAFLASRGVQLTTADPQTALRAGSLSLSIAPYLVWALVGFGRNLDERSPNWCSSAFLAAVSVAWTVAILGTPWFVEPEVSTRTDWFGNEHIAVHARWPATLLTLYIAGALVWGMRRMRQRNRLARRERLVLGSSLVIYAALGMSAILTSAGVLRIPALAEFGPFVVAAALSYLLVQREQSIERQLEASLERERSRLAASEERYRDLMQRAPVGVFVCDPRGEVRAINPRMRELLDALGSGTGDGGARSRERLAASAFRETIDTVLGEQRLVRREIRPAATLAPHGDAAECVWQVTASPLDDADDGERGVLVLVDDVTERSRLERQLRQSQKMDSIGQLAAGIAHEINNPMAYVRANLAALSEHWNALRKATGPDDLATEAHAEIEVLIEESMEGVERTIAIVRDMREFAHTGEELRGRSDLCEIVEACIRMASIVEKSEVEIRNQVPADLLVDAAAGPLRQVFLNLLVNALQAVGGRGKVWVEAERDGRYVRVTVNDDGPGIPECDRARVFDPFFTTKPVGEGTGLGLYISYQIVRSYDGDLRVSNAAHAGATFEVCLPAARD